MNGEPTILDEARLLLELAQAAGVGALALADLSRMSALLRGLAAHPACDDDTRGRAEGTLLVFSMLMAAHPDVEAAPAAG